MRYLPQKAKRPWSELVRTGLTRGVRESDPFAWHAHAFDNWAFVVNGCWDELVHLTLTELRVLHLQLREIAAADKRDRIPPATVAAISGPVQLKR